MLIFVRKSHYIKDSLYLVLFSICTIPGITLTSDALKIVPTNILLLCMVWFLMHQTLIETVLTGDLLYFWKSYYQMLNPGELGLKALCSSFWQHQHVFPLNAGDNYFNFSQAYCSCLSHSWRNKTSSLLDIGRQVHNGIKVF